LWGEGVFHGGLPCNRMRYLALASLLPRMRGDRMD
jgi:hypothetical protein